MRTAVRGANMEYNMGKDRNNNMRNTKARNSAHKCEGRSSQQCARVCAWEEKFKQWKYIFYFRVAPNVPAKRTRDELPSAADANLSHARGKIQDCCS